MEHLSNDKIFDPSVEEMDESRAEVKECDSPKSGLKPSEGKIDL